ncbi:MAG: hypothetical protein EZS28_013941 [Streblomastix strix]|uniref:Uncharacterized protein n=1 Tax=Streblomastix strix TaxID=222440 RepID=A0A5J4W7A7_9EUKA|nr:MAG: hypothetical protein EZS28_013941 [Streblomastix strix]
MLMNLAKPQEQQYSLFDISKAYSVTFIKVAAIIKLLNIVFAVYKLIDSLTTLTLPPQYGNIMIKITILLEEIEHERSNVKQRIQSPDEVLSPVFVTWNFFQLYSSPHITYLQSSNETGDTLRPFFIVFQDSNRSLRLAKGSTLGYERRRRSPTQRLFQHWESQQTTEDFTISVGGNFQSGGIQTILRKRYELFVCSIMLNRSHAWEIMTNGELQSLNDQQCRQRARSANIIREKKLMIHEQQTFSQV